MDFKAIKMRILIKQQTGLSVLVVLLLLILLSLFTVSLRTLISTQHMGSAYAAQAAQGYFLARAGVEYAMARITTGGGCGGMLSSLSLQGYSISISCTAAGPYDEGNPLAAYSVYTLSASASSGNFQAPNVVNRSVRASIKFP